MKINLTAKQTLKTTLNLKLWSPILYSNILQLNNYVQNICENNPFVEIQENHFIEEFYSNHALQEQSLVSDLMEQIEAPLFPTPISQKIAYAIIDEINEEGYFEGNIQSIAQENNTTIEMVEKIRQRFLHLNPIGVGALNLQETLAFQVDDLELKQEEKASLLRFIHSFKIEDIQHTQQFSKYFKQLHFPPAVKYLNQDILIVPDFIVHIDEDELKLLYNDKFSAEVTFDKNLVKEHKELKEKLKEARNLIEFLDLRKKTLHTIVLLIINHQRDFFHENKPLRPLTMQKIADELDFSQSTISRAISNKYLDFNHQSYSLKSFFVQKSGSEELSSEHIKKAITKLIEAENKTRPYSDESLKKLINKEFGIELSRRVIAKYRLDLNYLSSTNRKKLYTL